MGAELHVIMRSGVLRLNVCLQDFWIPQFLFCTPKVTYIEFCCTDAVGWASGSVYGHKKNPQFSSPARGSLGDLI